MPKRGVEADSLRRIQPRISRLQAGTFTARVALQMAEHMREILAAAEYLIDLATAPGLDVTTPEERA